MLEKNDWRLLNQKEFLRNVKLKKTDYTKPSDKWDHDHCAFCRDKFSENEGDLQKVIVLLTKSIGFVKNVITISKKCLTSRSLTIKTTETTAIRN